jgi:microcin C transport system substrate-binding protein
MSRFSPLVTGVLFALGTFLASCGGGEAPKEEPKEEAAAAAYQLNIPRVKYNWDPQAGDASVSAELGGPGFTGEGWLTREEMSAVGDKSAPQGGSLSSYMPDWPPTLRQAGKDWNTYFNYFVRDACYHSLLDLDQETMDFVPELATHWQISEDKTTYRFRINPKARWSDGKEITSADVVATWKLLTDPTLLDPSGVMTYGRFEEPKAISKYIVEVKTTEESWRNFLYFSGMSVFPAHQISMPGSQYLDEYQFKLTAVSGPYGLVEEDIKTGDSITLRRRSDWWGDDIEAWDGLYNIAELKFVVVKEPQLAFEKVKKGELDYYPIPKAQWWVEEVPKIEAVQRGLLVPTKFYTDAPHGISGLALNMSRPPLDDIKVRRALQLLMDRKTMIEKLYFNEYKPLDSYESGAYANPDNEKFVYDEFGAVQLLEEAGWKEKDAEGYRVKDGKQLSFKVTYNSPLSERSLTVYQEACKKAGIKLELELLTPAAAWKNLTQKQYDIQSVAWGGLTFPNPETSWKSDLAKQQDNNNVTAFANPEVDKLLDAYNKEYDPQRRIEIIREIDGIIYKQHPYVLEHYNPSQRVLYWNKFGMPAWGTSRFGEVENMFLAWWVDPAKDKELAAAKADPNAKMEPGPAKVEFWPAWNAEREKKSPGQTNQPSDPSKSDAPADGSAEAKHE